MNIVVLSRLVAIKLATVPLAAIVALAMDENVTEPEEADPAGGALKLLVESVAFAAVLKISRAVALVVPAANLLITESTIVFLSVVSEIVIAIIFYIKTPLA